MVLSFTTKELNTEGSGTIETVLKLKNTSKETLEGSIDITSATNDLIVVQRNPKAIKLKANDSLFIVIKAIVTRKASPQKPINVVASFVDLKTTEKTSTSMAVQIREKRLVRMLLSESNYFYERTGDTIQIPIRFTNDGNTTESITILTRFPELISELKKNVFTIQAYSDTLVILKKRITREIMAKENFPIGISALYKNGDIIGIATMETNSIKQNRRYVPSSIEDNRLFNSNNQVSVNRQFSSTNEAIYSLFLNGEAQKNRGKLYTNWDLNWWQHSNKFVIRNAWIGYKAPKFGIQLGNLSKFNILGLAGRGLETTYKLSANNAIELGLLEKSFTVINYSLPSLGQSGWINFVNKNGWDKGATISLLYDHNTFEKNIKAIFLSQFSIIHNPNFSLQIGTALSQLHTFQNSEKYWGGATEVNFSGKTANLFYNSSNYISSGYFAGNQSGALNLIENIRFNRNQYSFWADFNHFGLASKIQTNTHFDTPKFQKTQFSFGISKRFDSALFSLSLDSSSEKRSEFLSRNSSLNEYELHSKDITISGNYFKNSQNINLTLGTGIFRTNWNTMSDFHLKTTLNYNWKFINLMVFYQYNIFELGEIMISQKKTNKTYFNLLISPSFQADFFSQKVRLQSGLLYSNNNLIPTSFQFHNRIDFDWNKNLTFYISNFYSDFSANYKAFTTVKFGLIKRFNPIKLDEKRSDLELYLFYDTTRNGANDAKNLPAPNQLVLINGKAFRTNEHGIVKYKKLPKGEYEIRTILTNEWYADAMKITVEKSLKQAIGLSKTCTIKGNVNYYTTNNSFHIEQKKGGLQLILTDETGAVFRTKTDDSGKFTFYVPKSNYRLTLETSGLSEYVSVVSNDVPVKALPETIIEISFRLEVKERSIEIKKFSEKKF
jgi:hypothetical protein